MGPDDPSRGWQPLTSLSSHADIMAALDDAIVRVRFAPQSPDTRRRLRALAALPAVREPAIGVLKEQARRALIQEPAAAAVLLEVLVRTYESLDRPVEAIDAMEQLVALTPDSVDHL